MADEPLMALYTAHRESQQNYTYFMLAAAGAAVGFAVEKTEGLHLSWDLGFVAAAAASWGLSFYCGCKNIIWSQSVLYANYNLLRVRQGVHPPQALEPQLASAALAGIENALSSNASWTEFYARWQFRLFLGGAVLFIAWRVLQLVLASQAPALTG